MKRLCLFSCCVATIVSLDAAAQNQASVDLMTQPVEMEARILNLQHSQNPGCEFPDIDAVLPGNGIVPSGSLEMKWIPNTPTKGGLYTHSGTFEIGDHTTRNFDTPSSWGHHLPVNLSQIEDMKIHFTPEIREYDANAYHKGETDDYEVLRFTSLQADERIELGTLTNVLLRDPDGVFSYTRPDGHPAIVIFDDNLETEKVAPYYGADKIVVWPERFKTLGAITSQDDFVLSFSAIWEIFARSEVDQTPVTLWEPKVGKTYVTTIEITCYTNESNE